MGLFDLTLDDSPQACSLSALATALSESDAWQNLCEKETAADALTKIILGPDALPWDGGEFTHQEFMERFCEAQIWAPEEAEELFNETGNMGATPYRNGDFAIRVRRYIRESEATDPNRLYKYLMAASDLIGFQVMEYANLNFQPRVASMIGTNPMFSAPEHEVAQGKYAHWMYIVRWGDIEEQ